MRPGGRVPLAALVGDDPALSRRLEGMDAAVAGEPGIAVAGSAEYGRAGDVSCWLWGVAERSSPHGPLPQPAADLAALATHGAERALSGLRGTFLVVLWDRARRKGFAAVDPLGGRSCHWTRFGRSVALAGDLRDLLALLPRTPSPDRLDVLHFLTAGTPRPSGSLLDGVHRLAGGELLRLGGEPTVRRYWRPHHKPLPAVSREELAERTRDQVKRAVGRCLPAGGSAGLLLSGGVDSTTVGVAARALVPERNVTLRAYSGVFPADKEADEADRIERAVDALGLPWTRSKVSEVRPVAAALEHLAMWRVPTTAPNLGLWSPLLTQAVSDGTTVLLDGEGGDEVFGATPFALADLLRRGRVREARGLVAAFPGAPADLDARVVRKVLRTYGVAGAAPWPAHWLRRRLREPRAGLPQYVSAEDARRLRAGVDPWAWTRTPGPRWWAHLVHTLTVQRQALDSHGVLHRRARQFGFADAHPFMQDLELIEFALQLPPATRFDATRDRPGLREAMQPLLPAGLQLRTGKSRFTALFGAGLQGRDAELVERLLSPSTARIGAYVDHGRLAAEVARGPASYRRGRVAWAADVWRAASIEAWLRELERPGFAADQFERERPAVDQHLLAPATRT